MLFFIISCSLLSCSLLYKVVFFFSDAQQTRFTPTPRCRCHTVQYSLYIQHHVGDGLLLILLVVVEQNLLAAHHDVLQAHDRSHEVTSTRGIERNLSDKRRRLTFLAQPNFLVLFLTGSESQPSSRVSEEGRRQRRAVASASQLLLDLQVQCLTFFQEARLTLCFVFRAPGRRASLKNGGAKRQLTRSKNLIALSVFLLGKLTIDQLTIKNLSGAAHHRTNMQNVDEMHCMGRQIQNINALFCIDY